MASPRFHTRRRLKRSFGAEVAGLASELGMPLMRWQKRAVNVLLEHTLDDGVPVWRTPAVAISVPRQAGKSVLMLLVIAWWGLRWPNQSIVLVAPDRAGAARRLELLGNWLASAGHATDYFRGAGQERLEFKETGSRCFIVSASRSGGHGDSVDLAVLDECWNLHPQTLQALVPAQIARPHWYRMMISTAGDEDSEVWNATVDRGRESVDDPDSRLGYVEYSCPPTVDPTDVKTWRRFMPAMGETQTVQSVLDASEDLGGVGSGEWLRAFGNVTTRSDSSLFAVDQIDKALKGAPAAPDRVVVGVDVSQGPDAASVCAAWFDDDGKPCVAVVRRRHGEPSGWIVNEVRDVLRRKPGSSLVMAYGPSLVIKSEMEKLAEQLAVPLHDLNMTALAGASMRTFEYVRDGNLAVRDADDVFRDALLAARSKAVGDRWRFDRAVLIDQSPLIAAAIALDVAFVEGLEPAPFIRSRKAAV